MAKLRVHAQYAENSYPWTIQVSPLEDIGTRDLMGEEGADEVINDLFATSGVGIKVRLIDNGSSEAVWENDYAIELKPEEVQEIVLALRDAVAKKNY